MLAFLKRLLGFRSVPVRTRAPAASRTPPPAPGRGAPETRRPAAGHSVPSAAPPALAAAGGPQAALLELLDGKAHFQHALSGREEQVLSAVARRVESGDLVLPHLPSTSLAAMDMAAKPSANISDLVELIAGDPVLSSELLKVSNSVLYAGREKCETLREAVVRIGLRALRSMILAIAMRTVLLRDKALAHVAEEIWSQSHSVSLIARAIAPLLGQDRERAFLVGLLHDIGKVALLETVRLEARELPEVRPVLLGRVFYLMHEAAGERLARAWKLPDELVSVAGCHHRYERNLDHGRSAALASLAHSLDLGLRLGGELEAKRLQSLAELDYLDVAPERRTQVLETALATFAAARDGGADAARAA